MRLALLPSLLALLSLASAASCRATSARWQLQLRASDSQTATEQRARFGEDCCAYRESQFQLSRTSANFTEAKSTTTWRYRHDYRVFDLPAVAAVDGMTAGDGTDSVEAASNGHVHRLAFAWQTPFDRWHVRVAPTLAVSSNLLRQPTHMTGDDWQLHGALWQRLTTPTGQWRWGLRADDRFGRYRGYPMLQWQTVRDTWQLALGLPDSEWRWQVATHWQLAAVLEPDGGRWNVHDEQLQQQSALAQERWRAALGLHWQPGDAFRLGLDWSQWRHQQWQWRRLDGHHETLTRPNENAVHFSVALQF